MTERYTLAIDPGKKSGIALLLREDDAVTVVWSDELDEYETGDRINRTLSEYKGRIDVCCEDFVITPQTGKLSAAPWSLRIIGVTRYLCHAYGLPDPTLQRAGHAKDFVPNDRLKALQLWHKGGAGHAKDALRHGVLYLVERQGWRPENLLVR